MEVWLIGIGMGLMKHLTLEAVEAIKAADLILIPRKGADKADLADLRRRICDTVLDGIPPDARPVMAEFDLPVRDASGGYERGVLDWHDAIAGCWQRAIDAHLGARRVALLVWGDPALYDSSLRIADRLGGGVSVHVVPGIMSMQALTAAHGIPLNQIGAPFLVTTGRRLRDHGWPAGVDTLVVMLDGDNSFQTLDPAGVEIWWGAYVGMPDQILDAGPLAQAGPRIVAARAAARDRHGWIMDIYLLRRGQSD